MLKIINKDIVPIPNNPHMLRLAIIGKGLREFHLMLAISGAHKGKCYIEEYVPTTIDYKNDIFGNFKFIQDDEEAEELTRFCELHKLSDMKVRYSEMVEIGLGKVIFG